MGGDEFSGTELPVGQFRQLMNVPAPGNDLCFHGGRSLIDRLVKVVGDGLAGRGHGHAAEKRSQRACFSHSRNRAVGPSSRRKAAEAGAETGAVG